jgi:8-hydroxy-5-deazaflavin:NADPH oxidoreductase
MAANPTTSAQAGDRPGIGIIGKGNVGSALQRGLTAAGYDVRATGKDPGEVKQVGAWAGTVILAVPFGERQDALRELGDTVRGKTVIDVSNALGDGMAFAASLQRSGAEEVQELARGAHVVKAFNTVFAKHMDQGTAQGEPLTLFVASDHGDAKEQVLELGRALGFDALDAGPLENARWLETLGYLNVILGYKVGLGDGGGFRYVHPGHRAARGARPRQDQARERKPTTAATASPGGANER